MKLAHLILCSITLPLGLYAQTQQPRAPKPEFNAASIRPFARDPDGSFRVRIDGGPGTSDPTRINYVNITLETLLMSIYGLERTQISAPNWIYDTDGRFTIVATIAPGTTKEQFNEMLRNLLIDRFQIAMHLENREGQLYELTLVKQGPMLRPSLDPERDAALLSASTGPLITGRDGFRRIRPGQNPPGGCALGGAGRMTGGNQPLSVLAACLSIPLKTPVIDKTGLTGNWDYNLEYASGSRSAVAGGPSTPAPDLITAVREQLGLKLESKQGTVKILVIDHIEKTPSPN